MSDDAQVMNPLTLIMPVKSAEHARTLRELLVGLAQSGQSPIDAALNKLMSVHFARFVMLENDTRLAVITTYDGDFDDYIHDFIDELGPVFDKLLSFVEDAPALPVQENRDEFLAYVKKHDIPVVGSFYSAYPEVPVTDIVGLRPGASG